MTFCLAWFNPEQWALLKQKAADADELEEKYEDYLQSAKNLLQSMVLKGMRVKKVRVDVMDLERWCKEKGLQNTSKSRSQYAAEKGAENFKK
ncbi:hypothetical protein JW935_25490 [candidate division KSB1 bacterium]|nr:hypothetical protein [candidate division KSB1 bacterium]